MDLLDELWTNVINVDAEGKWLERGFTTPADLKSFYGTCATALKRLKNYRLPKELGLISRLVRYETVFGLLYSFADPGLPDGTKIDGDSIIKAALDHDARNKKLVPFLKSLSELLSLEDDGQWLVDLSKKKLSDEPFGDVGPAVKRALDKGVAVADLAQMAIWSRYEAVAGALSLMNKAKLSVPDDVCGLHESLLVADPSGKEGRPKSWPVVAKQGDKAGAKKEQPLWAIRSGYAIAFSPDGKRVAVGGSSGPARIHDARTGKELVECDGIKAHIYRLAFSADGKQLAIGEIRERICVCDAKTGKLISKTKVTNEEISDLVFLPKTGELLRSAWQEKIDVIDPQSGKIKEFFSPPHATSMVVALVISSEANRLCAVALPTGENQNVVTSWELPTRKVQTSFKIPNTFVSRAAISPDGTLVAVSTRRHAGGKLADAVALYDFTTGKLVHRIEKDVPTNVAFLNNGNLVAAFEREICFFEAKTWKQLRRIETGGRAYDLALSPDNKLLAAATKGVSVWEI